LSSATKLGICGSYEKGSIEQISAQISEITATSVPQLALAAPGFGPAAFDRGAGI